MAGGSGLKLRRVFAYQKSASFFYPLTLRRSPLIKGIPLCQAIPPEIR